LKDIEQSTALLYCKFTHLLYILFHKIKFGFKTVALNFSSNSLCLFFVTEPVCNNSELIYAHSRFIYTVTMIASIFTPYLLAHSFFH
jgi:hypothetical protein